MRPRRRHSRLPDPDRPPTADPRDGLALALPRRDGRDTLLVLAGEPLRSAVAHLGAARGYEVCATDDAAEATRILGERGPRIGYAIMTSDVAAGARAELSEALDTGFPEIRRIVVVA